MTDRSPYQQKIIKRYYENFDAIKGQRLAEIVTELYLAEGKKRDRLWKQAGEILEAFQLAPARVTHVLSKRDPAILAEIVKEILARTG